MKLIVTFFAYIALVYGRQIGGMQCHRSDSNVELCILDKFKAIKPALKIDPFTFSRVRDDAMVDGFRVKATLDNIRVSRGSDFGITHFDVNLNNSYEYTAEVQVYFPRLYVSADYNFQGHAYWWDYVTYGKANGRIDYVTAEVKCTASPFWKYGEKYLKLDSVRMSVYFGSGELNLYQYDDTLTGNEIASRVNNNPTKILRTMIPTIETNVSRLLKQLINRELARVPLNNMLVD